jgi:hypothetical protein
MIVVRTLNTVGGYRARPYKSVRKMNRFARSLGFRNWAAYVAKLAFDRLFRENLQRIAAQHPEGQAA